MLKYLHRRELISFASLIVLAGCAHRQETHNTPSLAPVAKAEPPRAIASSILPGSLEDFRTNVGDTVHFAFDRYQIEDSDKVLLQKQAVWLNKYPHVRVTIEGHCDERGTREYNLALGARRANSVKEYLVAQGVAFGRVGTISYGKERPICTESNEDCWAQNRRGVTSITSGAVTS